MYACDILRASERVPVLVGRVAHLLCSATTLIRILRYLLFVGDKLESVRDNGVADFLLLHLDLNASVTIFAENAVLDMLDTGFSTGPVSVNLAAIIVLFLLHHFVEMLLRHQLIVFMLVHFREELSSLLSFPNSFLCFLIFLVQFN